MRQPLAVVCAVIVSFGLGMLLAGSIGAPDAEADASSWELVVPAAAERLWFPPAEQYDNEGEPLSDESFEELMKALDVAMTAEETLADFEREADLHLWNFVRRLAVPEVSDEQKERINAYLDALAEEHPDSRAIKQRRMLVDSYSSPMPSMPPFVGFATLFQDPEGLPNEGEPFEDAQVDQLLAILDATLSVPEATGNFQEEASVPLWQTGNRLQRGTLSEEQTARVVAFLDKLAERYPDADEELDKHRYLIENLMPGKVAPNIVGTDTEGAEFALEDYRGRIVALIFSGQWCGPCRGEYPYQRAMLEIYGEEDVALLGVNSDAVLDTIVQAKEREGLAYRTWWDGHDQPDAEYAATEGPIATQWNVLGWPQIYVLDEEGVIRHTDKRGGSLIAAVDELVMEKRMRQWEAEREAAEAEAETEGGEAEATEDEAGAGAEADEEKTDGDGAGDDGPVAEVGRG